MFIKYKNQNNFFIFISLNKYFITIYKLFINYI